MIIKFFIAGLNCEGDLFVGIKLFAVAVEPILAHFSLGIKFSYALPKGARVVLVQKVRNFMRNQIVYGTFGSQRNAPIIVNVVQR